MTTKKQIIAAIADNPHWIDGHPAWDITLRDGSIDKGVSAVEIRHVHQIMDSAGLLGTYAWHVDVVRQRNVDNYADWRDTNQRQIDTH